MLKQLIRSIAARSSYAYAQRKIHHAQMVCASVVHWSKNVALGLGKNAFVNLVATNLLQMQPTPVPSLCLKTLFQIVAMKSIVMNILNLK